MKTNLLITSLAVLLAFASCQSDAPEPINTPNPPTDNKNTPGGNKDSISVFKRTKISWAATDYKEIEYDASNTPIRYTTQNLYNQETGQVYKVVYNFIYAGSQLTRLEASNGSYVTYTYTDGKVSRTEEFGPTGKLFTTRRYQYFPDNRLKNLQETQGEGTNKIETAHTYEYDSKGNLAQVIDFTKYPQNNAYHVALLTKYSDYDSHKNVTGLWALYPFLPNATLQAHNPTTITQYSVNDDGAEKQIRQIKYAYRYNAQGYPISHTQTDQGGSLTATYTYAGQ